MRPKYNNNVKLKEVLDDYFEMCDDNDFWFNDEVTLLEKYEDGDDITPLEPHEHEFIETFSPTVVKKLLDEIDYLRHILLEKES